MLIVPQEIILDFHYKYKMCQYYFFKTDKTILYDKKMYNNFLFCAKMSKI